MTITINGSGPITGSDRAELGTNDDITSLGAVTSINGGQFGLRNKIINGKMEIAQRGTSFAGFTAGYSLDRWQVYLAGSVVATVTQQADAPSGDEFQSSYRYAVTTADASIAAGDYAIIRQSVEGYNARDLIGRTFTLSFWVRSSKTGAHCIVLQNSGSDRSYVSEYTINAANTWEKKSITVSGGLVTAGTQNWTTGVGVSVSWALAAGTTAQTTANAWQTGSFLATANQVNCLDTIGNIFAITGVQLEVGSVATPFEHRPYGMELALCQRYYSRVVSLTGICAGAATFGAAIVYPVEMRASPTFSLSAVLKITDTVAADFTQSSTSVAIVIGSRVTNTGAQLTFANFSGLTSYRTAISIPSETGAVLMSAEL